MDPTFPLVPIVNILAFILVLLPLSVMIVQRSWNISLISFAFWVSVMSIVTAINTIVWSDNVNDVAPVWCDIVTHLKVGRNIGVAACSLAISRRLYNIVSLRQALSSNRERRIDMIIDIGLCIGLPVVAMGLYYIVQEVRYIIWEEYGCANAQVVSGLSLLLLDIWPAVLPAISTLVYCPRILWLFYRQRREVNEFLSSGSSTETRSSYFRQMALGSLDALITLPLGTVSMVSSYGTLNAPFVFAYPWNMIHSDWAPIMVTENEWVHLPWHVFAIKQSEWTNPILAVVFFTFFGISSDARRAYKRAIGIIAKEIGLGGLKATKETCLDKLEMNSENVVFAHNGQLLQLSPLKNLQKVDLTSTLSSGISSSDDNHGSFQDLQHVEKAISTENHHRSSESSQQSAMSVHSLDSGSCYSIEESISSKPDTELDIEAVYQQYRL